MRIGVDEAGRGPAIGPLVVCAFQTPISQLERLAEIGVDDSKQLTPIQRKTIANNLTIDAEKGLWSFNIIVANAERIDRIMAIENLNDLEVTLFAEAISGLIDKHTNESKSTNSDPDDLAEPVNHTAQKIRARNDEQKAGRGSESKQFSDETFGVISLDACDVNEARFGNRVFALLQPDWRKWKVESKHGMDAVDIVVGAASILAKVKRDEIIKEIATEIGFDIGSGYPSDPKTIAAIPRLMGGATPHDQCRWRWKTIRRAWREKHGGQPPDRPPPDDSQIGGQTTLDFFSNE
jgi:ribonuclease HII